jgi:hypothetical protein
MKMDGKRLSSVFSFGACLLLSLLPSLLQSQTAESYEGRWTRGMEILEREARLSIDGVTVDQALAALEAGSGINLAYRPHRLPRTTVSCQCYDLTVKEALDRMLPAVGLWYGVFGDQIVIEPEPLPLLRPSDHQGRFALAESRGTRETDSPRRIESG